ncbi:MAG: PQQ-binding-like beta-propeller repeat protein [Planctomycetes bacterium]|nr:PQQ-binding-like beta-propeller repeat protein [Planctomycetota bacterium]
MKKVRGAALSAAVGAVVVAGLGIASVRGPIEAQEAPAQAARKPIQIDLSQSAQKVRLNQEVSAAKGATAARFPTVHGAGDGWALRVAGNNPRSPAAQDGVVVVGTGSGNTVFGVEVETGLVRWSAVSKDSGISSVIVAGDSAYFTTWSCTLERVRVSDGHHEFSKWLASTVECAPDANESRVVCSYQGNVSDHDLNTGAQGWKSEAKEGVVTAPVICGDAVYTVSPAGSLTSFALEGGKKRWSRNLGAVAAPVATPQGLLVAAYHDGSAETAPAESQKPAKNPDRETVVTTGQIGRTLLARGDRRVALLTGGEAAPKGSEAYALNGPAGSTGLDFQGMRPGFDGGVVYLAGRGALSASLLATGNELWSVQLSDSKVELTTPVVSGGMLFTAGSDGTVLALEATSGALVWAYQFEGVAFAAKPCVEKGRLLLTTNRGMLLCLPTGAQDTGEAPPLGGGSGAAPAKNEPGMPGVFRGVRDAFEKNRTPVPAPSRLPENVTPARGPETPAVEGPDTDAGAEGPASESKDEPSKGEWERREERREAKARSEGKDYERKPFKRN